MAEPLEMSIRLFLEPEEEAAMPADGALGNWLDRSHSLEIFSGRAIPSAFSAPGSDDWFSNMRQRRHERHARWLAPILEFAKHPGERVLGMGHTLGSDWVEYARQGSEMVVCDSDPEHLEIARAHFKSTCQNARFLQKQPRSSRIPLATGSLDVAVLNWLNESEACTKDLMDEVFRCLKPGGKVIALCWARFSVHWRHWFQPTTGFHQITHAEARKLLEAYQDARVRRRHLRRGDMPRIMRWIPAPLIERMMGRVMILKGFKPLTSVLPLGRVA
ncbi:MAG: class I SAM-dependent methyltransferase [Planctomycetota bacterium]|nr:class I SAM-dependent methyltransferase [Planctomycetota bacterium]